MADIITEFGLQSIIAVIGAFVGAYFGLRFARSWDRKKRDEELNATRKNSIDSIIAELKEIQKGMESSKGFVFHEVEPNFSANADGDKWVTLDVAFLSISAYESIVNSGSFSILDSSLQQKISKAYQAIDNLKYIAKVVQQKSISDPDLAYHKKLSQEYNLFNQWHTALGSTKKKIDELLPELENLKLENKNLGK